MGEHTREVVIAGAGADRTGDPPYGATWSAARRRGSEAELEGWLAFALDVAAEADAIALRHFRADLDVRGKADGSFVTQADTAIERLVRERIADAYPAHGIVGEEEEAHQAGAAVRWYVDPIDGTHNFMRGVPLFGTLLGCERDGELQVGVLSAPALGERWHARRGGGAWAVVSGGAREGSVRRARVSAVDDLAQAQLLYSSFSDIEASGRAPGFLDAMRGAWRTRGFGDFWGYALVAEGAAEAMFEVDVHTWDLAAPVVIVEEAGGRITDLRGERRIDSGSMLVSNGVLHDRMLAALWGADTPPGSPGA
jgi:histidinol-phosphatase